MLAAPAALCQDAVQTEVQTEVQSALQPPTQSDTQIDQQHDAADLLNDMPAAYVASSHEIMAYNRAIKEAESREGAYGSGLSESLLGLAQILQSQGRHEEAIELFKRGVHVTRVNEGLYCQQQIPMLHGEIASYKATQNYAQADTRQNYLYHVQTQSMGSGDALAAAFMEQAKWQHTAYQLGLSQVGYDRLIGMFELNRMAFNDVVAREGETSPKLLPPLRGMLQAQYLISAYNIRPSTPVFTTDGQVDEGLLRFKAYHARSYKQGNAIIAAISKVKAHNSAAHGYSDTPSLVMLGDWNLWNGKTDAAWQAYHQATTELARTNDAQVQVQHLFEEPVALPDFTELRLLPPVVEPSSTAVTLAFEVNEYGRVRDVERLDENATDDQQAYRLIRQLRNTTFRPRFEAGQPVETQNLVKAFHLQ